MIVQFPGNADEGKTIQEMTREELEDAVDEILELLEELS